MIRGGQEFFGATKAIYNALHGTPVTPTTAMRNLFLEEAAENAASLDLDADLVVIHDPQPLPLGAPRRWRRGPGWVTPALERAPLAHGSGDRP